MRLRDGGQVTAFTVVMTGALIALTGLVLDAGLAVATKTHAVGVAQSAARAGAMEIDLAHLRTTGEIRLDPRRARAAASDWLTRSGVPGTVTATAEEVTVTVTTARRTQLLGLVGVDEIPVAASATARALPPG